MADLPTALAALDLLNSYVRHHDATSKHGPGLRDLVYFLKRIAIIDATRAGIAAHSRIVTVAKCKSCNGTGDWYHWRDYDQSYPEACRRCSGRGRVDLEFIETSLTLSPTSAVTWHTPLPRWPYPELGEPSFTFLLTNWTPNTPGRGLPVDALVHALNIVETYWTARPPRPEWDPSAYQYAIDLGDAERACAFCGNVDVLIPYHVRRGALHWTAYKCDGCACKGIASWDPYPWPASFTPAVREWMERNAPAVVEVTRG